MLQDEALHFQRIGTFLEHADSTARLLDVKFENPVGGDVSASVAKRAKVPATPASQEDDFCYWSAVLRSVSGFGAHRKVYRNVIRPDKVAALGVGISRDFLVPVAA